MENLVYLAAIWVSVFISYYLADRTKLTPLLFYLLMGSIMVTVGILPQQSTPFISGFSEFGIILIMFALGFEENSGMFVRSIKRSWGIALFRAIGPFVAAYWVALTFWQSQDIALMAGLTMTATAVSLTMVVLKFEGLHLTKAASGIMTSAVLDDVASLVLVAVMIPLVTHTEAVSLVGVAMVLGKALAFFILVFFFSQYIFPGRESIRKMKLPKWARWFGLHDLLAFSEGKVATLAILTIAIISGIVAHYMGLHPAVGAYMSGLIMRKRYFFHFKQGEKVYSYKKTRKIIDDVAFAWIGPVFFVNLGSKIILDPTIIASVIGVTIMFTFAVSISQIISAALAARYTGDFSFEESMMIGFGMLGRAELAFVVLDIGYVHSKIMNTEVFYSLMFTTFALNIMVPLCIKFWKPYFSGDKQLVINR